MNTKDLFTAYLDVAAHMAEHEGCEEIERALGLDSDDFDAVLGAIAGRLDRTMVEAGTPFWPPETRTDRATGLSVAAKIAVLAALTAVENARRDVPYG